MKSLLGQAAEVSLPFSYSSDSSDSREEGGLEEGPGGQGNEEEDEVSDSASEEPGLSGVHALSSERDSSGGEDSPAAEGLEEHVSVTQKRLWSTLTSALGLMFR